MLYSGMDRPAGPNILRIAPFLFVKESIKRNSKTFLSKLHTNHGEAGRERREEIEYRV
jgi:hypothetical protein